MFFFMLLGNYFISFLFYSRCLETKKNALSVLFDKSNLYTFSQHPSCNPENLAIRCALSLERAILEDVYYIIITIHLK